MWVEELLRWWVLTLLGLRRAAGVEGGGWGGARGAAGGQMSVAEGECGGWQAAGGGLCAVRDVGLRLPPGGQGVVIATPRDSRRMWVTARTKEACGCLRRQAHPQTGTPAPLVMCSHPHDVGVLTSCPLGLGAGVQQGEGGLAGKPYCVPGAEGNGGSQCWECAGAAMGRVVAEVM